MVDNADMQRVARMVTETQRVRVRLLWDDQRMRQTTAAAGLDRLGKTMAAAAGLDRLGKTMAAAYGLNKVGKTMTAVHRERMRPLLNTPKFVGPMFGGELQRAAEAHRAWMQPALDASKVIRFAVGGEKMRQMMAAAAGLDKVAKVVADTQRMRMWPLFDTSKVIKVGLGGDFEQMTQAMVGAYRVRMPPLFDTQKLVGSMFGGGFERIAQAMADAYRAPVPLRFDVQGVVKVAQGLADVTIAAPSTATTESLAVVDGSVPAKAPPFPGLMDPWEQVRFWNLQAWIAFLALLVAVAGLLVSMGQSRPQGGLSPEELETAIRIIQENGEPKTSTPAPNSSTGPTRSKPTRPLDGEKGQVPTVRPPPTSG